MGMGTQHPGVGRRRVRKLSLKDLQWHLGLLKCQSSHDCHAEDFMLPPEASVQPCSLLSLPMFLPG